MFYSVILTAAVLMTAREPGGELQRGIAGFIFLAQLPHLSPLLPRLAANPADVSSIDAILHAAYDTISGTRRPAARLGPLSLPVCLRRPPGRCGSKPPRQDSVPW